MRRRWPKSCAALILSVVACGGKSAEERIAEHERVRVAWEQTVRFVGAEWAGRAIPDAYAARTLERASEELSAENDKLGKDEVPEEMRAQSQHALSATRALADSLERGVRAKDRGTVARLVENSPNANADSLLRQAALR